MSQRVSFAETIEKSSDCLLVREFSKVIANERDKPWREKAI